MKIAHIGQKGIPATFGGVESHVDRISRRQAQRGHDVRVYVRNWYTPKNLGSYDGVRLIHIPTLKTKHLDAAVHTFLCTLHCLFQRTDIIHYHAIGPASFSFIPRFFGRKVVMTVHRLDWAAEKWGRLSSILLRAGEWVGLRAVHAAIAVSEDIRRYIKTVHEKDASLIPNGVDAPHPMPPMLIKEKYGLKGKDYVLFLGRLTPEKRVEWLIQSFREAKKGAASPEKLKLVIAGGTSGTDVYVERLRGLGAGESEIVFTGYVTGREKDELLTNALFFILPSSLEGHPITLLEAKSLGCCTIASDIPAHREAIKNGVDGFLFRSDDRGDLTQKLRRLIQDPALIERVGEASRAAMRSRPSWEAVADRTLEVYRTLLHPPAPPASPSKEKET